LKGHTLQVNSVAWSSNGRLASGSDDSTVIIWDFVTGKPAQILHGHTGPVTSAAWSADGILASGSDDGTVIIWDLATGESSQILQGHTGRIISMAWSADGRLATGLEDGMLIVWDLTTGRPAQNLREYTNPVISVAWSADGSLASTSYNEVIIWDVAAGKSAQTLRGHTPPSISPLAIGLVTSVNSVAWSADGQLASAAKDSTVIIWDLSTGKPVATLRGHPSSVNGVSWSTNGRLASGSDDGTVIIWDRATGQPAQILRGHTGPVTSVAWSVDGRLASGSEDNTVKIARADLIRGRPCDWFIRNMTPDEWITYQGPLYVYQPACPNLPIPTIDPVDEFRNGNLKFALQFALITWKGRIILLGVALVFLAILVGILSILYKLIIWLRDKIIHRFRREPGMT
jgi:WD40 repeat protein